MFNVIVSSCLHFSLASCPLCEATPTSAELTTFLDGTWKSWRDNHVKKPFDDSKVQAEKALITTRFALKKFWDDDISQDKVNQIADIEPCPDINFLRNAAIALGDPASAATLDIKHRVDVCRVRVAKLALACDQQLPKDALKSTVVPFGEGTIRSLITCLQAVRDLRSFVNAAQNAPYAAWIEAYLFERVTEAETYVQEQLSLQEDM